MDVLDLRKYPKLAQMVEQLSNEKGYKDMKEFLCDVFSEAVETIRQAQRNNEAEAFDVLIALHEYKELIDELAENGKYPFPKIAGL